MGIPGLWTELEPVACPISLAEFAITRGLAAEGGARQVRIGIDAAVFLYKALGKFKKRYSGSPPMPELQDIVSKLLHLAQTPLTAVFVFDGPQRPSVKRGRNTVFRTHWLVRVFKEFIEVMGFLCLDAPGEAEAELARLSDEGFIDAVMTEDVDAFAFGAKVVIRIIDFSQHEFKLYRAVDCENDPGVRLSRAGMVLVALLSGGDYDKGLDKCGVTTSIRVARYGLADSLIDIVNMPSAMQALELAQWRARLIDVLAHDPQDFLRRREVQLSASIPSTFPNIDIIQLYYRPIVRPSPRSNPFSSDTRIIPRPVDVNRFLKLASRHLWWSTYELLARKGCNTIFPSLLTRETLAILDDPKLKLTSPIKKICKLRGASSSKPGVSSFRIQYNATPYLVNVCHSLDEPSPDSSHGPSLQLMWLPIAIMERTHPELVAEFYQRRPVQASVQGDRAQSQAVEHIHNGGIAQPPLVLSTPQAGPSSDIAGFLSPGSLADPFETSDEEEHFSDQRLLGDYQRVFGSSSSVVRLSGGRCNNKGDNDVLEISSDSDAGQPPGPSSPLLMRARALNEQRRSEAFREIETAEALLTPVLTRSDHAVIPSPRGLDVVEISSSSGDESVEHRTTKRARTEYVHVARTTERPTTSRNSEGPKAHEVVVIDSELD